MDNARIHHAEEIENLVQDYGMSSLLISRHQLMKQQAAILNISLHTRQTSTLSNKLFLL
jgi:hypothetical protein